MRVVDEDVGDLEVSPLAVDGLRGFQGAGRKRSGDREDLHDRARLEPIGDGAETPRVDVRLPVVVRVVGGHRGEREDLPRRRIDDDDRRPLRLVGALRRVQLGLGDVLDRFVDRERYVLAGERLFVGHPLGEDEAPAAVAEPFDLVDATAKVFVHRQLEAILALAVGSHEPEHRSGELASGVVAMPFAFDGEATHGVRRLTRITEIANALGFLCADTTLHPDEAVPRLELGQELVGIERERLRDPRGGVAKRGFLIDVGFDVAQELGHVDAHARNLDAHRQGNAVAVEDRPALGFDVKATLALTLGGFAPRRAILDLNVKRCRDDGAEPQPHGAAENAHPETDPARARGVEVSHGGISSTAVAATLLSPGGASGRSLS